MASSAFEQEQEETRAKRSRQEQPLVDDSEMSKLAKYDFDDRKDTATTRMPFMRHEDDMSVDAPEAQTSEDCERRRQT